MKSLAIIPARGGSKRIPNKNIKSFLGKPIIAYSIQTAIDSKLFDEIMVSTDDNRIAEIALQYGAKVPFIRSEANSNDYATIGDTMIEVLKMYEDHGCNPEIFCCLFPTAPLINVEVLKNSYDIFLNGNADFLVPVVRYGYPIQRAVRKNSLGYLEMFDPSQARSRSQDLEPSFHDAGQFYWAYTQSFKMHGRFMSGRALMYEITEMDAQDIDNMEDWKIAEFKYQLKYKNED